MKRARTTLALLAVGAIAPPALGGPADVVAAEAECNAQRVCTFRVGVRHADAGWDHYADRWQVLAPDGTVLATRILHHPHVEEQPFTRSLRDVEIPTGLTEVRVRAHDSVHGFGGAEQAVPIP